MIDTPDKEGEGTFENAKEHPPVRAPLWERTGGCGTRSEKFLIPRFAFKIFLAGAPFITETPRQGALGGLTPYKRNQQLAAAM